MIKEAECKGHNGSDESDHKSGNSTTPRSALSHSLLTTNCFKIKIQAKDYEIKKTTRLFDQK